MAPRKIADAAPLTGAEMAIVIQDGKPVRTSTQDIAGRAPSTPGQKGDKGDKGDPGASVKGDKGDTGSKGDPGAAGSPKRIERYTSTTNSSGIATIVFSPAFAATPDIDVIDGWNGDQMITGAVVPGSASKTGCQVQVMVSRGTLLLTTGPFQKAATGVSITARAIGN